MKKSKLILSVLIGFMIYSCSSVQAVQEKKRSYIKIGKDELYIRGTMKCPSNDIVYLNNNKNIDLSFNKDICSMFKKEQDSLEDKVVLWYMDWSKFDNGFYPISSLVNIYEGEKLKLERSMSFKTWPFVEDQEAFKKSLYFRLSLLRPLLGKKSMNDSLSRVRVLLTIKK